jgi:hypothetical protein
LLVIGVLLVTGLLVHRVALRDLRRLEQDYIAAREPTACATQELVPLALGPDGRDSLDATVLKLTKQALSQSVRLRDDFTGRKVAPFPPVRSARSALAEALDKQVALYQAMVDDPDTTDDDLRALGHANTRFERRAESARRLLLVGKGSGWARRFVCDVEPPPVPPE